ncbi:hypothetical protein TruAng_003317 [Truncatella angustata]|nr:hypothetical protein TruAng_003317 [Truncatella angustata]
MAVLETTKGGYYLWNYLPSVPAAVIFLLLFLVMTSLISWRMFKTKTWFCIPLVIGGFFEFAGYCARASAHNKTGKIMPYAVQNFYILLGPTLFAASIYMCLGRIIRGVQADHHSLIQPRKLTRTFVTGDVLSLVVQGGAAGLMVTGKNASLGEGIKRINRNPTPESGMAGAPWKKSMRMLFIVSSLIMIRSLFRVVEFAMGNSGYPLKHEWTLYVFDSVLMVTVMVVYHLWYPTWIVEGKPDVEAYGI